MKRLDGSIKMLGVMILLYTKTFTTHELMRSFTRLMVIFLDYFLFPLVKIENSP